MIIQTNPQNEKIIQVNCRKNSVEVHCSCGWSHVSRKIKSFTCHCGQEYSFTSIIEFVNRVAPIAELGIDEIVCEVSFEEKETVENLT